MTRAVVEIHGYVHCPFAWRVRLTAAEKQIAAEWIPSDVPDPDPRAAAHNPDDHSPLLWHEGFTVLESEVIGHYLDEAFPGRALMAADPKARAAHRLAAVHLRPMDVHKERRPDEARTRSQPALRVLEHHLASGAPFLLGQEPGLVDLHVWPFLSNIAVRGLLDGGAFPRSQAYLERALQRPSFRSTRPPWAAPLTG